MRIEFDPNNSAHNAQTVALALLADRLHVVCFTPVPGGIRVISFRKANAREVHRHAHP